MLRTRSARARLLVLPLAAAIALGACSNGDDDNASDTSSDKGADASTTTSEASKKEATSGSGEIVVGGTAYAFTSDECSIGEGSTADVEIKGKGNTGGRDYEVEVIRSKPASNYVERVKLAWSGVEASVATKIGGEDAIAFQTVDGKLTGSGLSFTGAGGAPSGDGTVTASCGK